MAKTNKLEGQSWAYLRSLHGDQLWGQLRGQLRNQLWGQLISEIEEMVKYTGNNAQGEKL
jgi:hypothetical protein